MTKVVKQQLRPRLSKTNENNNTRGTFVRAMSSVYSSIFGSSEAEPEEEKQNYDYLCKDRKFLKKLKSELKYFEICMRMFEEAYIGVVLHSKQEVMEKNVHHLQKEQGELKQIIKDRYFDPLGNLLPEHELSSQPIQKKANLFKKKKKKENSRSTV